MSEAPASYAVTPLYRQGDLVKVPTQLSSPHAWKEVWEIHEGLRRSGHTEPFLTVDTCMPCDKYPGEWLVRFKEYNLQSRFMPADLVPYVPTPAAPPADLEAGAAKADTFRAVEPTYPGSINVPAKNVPEFVRNLDGAGLCIVAIAEWEELRAEAAALRQQLADALQDDAEAQEAVQGVKKQLAEAEEARQADREQHKAEVLEILRDMRLPMLPAQPFGTEAYSPEFRRGANSERLAINDYCRQKAYEYSPEGIGPDPVKLGEW